MQLFSFGCEIAQFLAYTKQKCNFQVYVGVCIDPPQKKYSRLFKQFSKFSFLTCLLHQKDITPKKNQQNHVVENKVIFHIFDLKRQ